VLKLYGFAVSNYFNMVRMALDAKGLDYETVVSMPSQEDDWLQKSPLGKVPVLETDDGCLSETLVILDYLEDAYPENPLFPADPFAKAQVRQMLQVLKLYIELPARRLFPGVFFGGKNPELTIEEVRPVLEKGARAVKQLGAFKPYLMGEQVTAADFVAMYSLDLAAGVAAKTYQWDLLADIPGAAELLERLGSGECAQRIAAEKNAQMAAFLSKVRGG